MLNRETDTQINSTHSAISSLVLFRVPQHKNHTVPPQKHFAYEPVLVYWLCSPPPLPRLGDLRPQLLHVFKDHVAMPVKCFHVRQEFPVVSTIDQDLRAGLNAGRQDRQGPSAKFLLFFLLPFVNRHRLRHPETNVPKAGGGMCPWLLSLTFLKLQLAKLVQTRRFQWGARRRASVSLVSTCQFTI